MSQNNAFVPSLLIRKSQKFLGENWKIDLDFALP